MGGGVSTEKVEQMAQEFLAEDVNNDGRVTLDEFKAYHKKSEGWLGAYDEAKTEVEFKKFDTNNDGFLLLDEYLESHGVKKKLAEQVSNDEAIKRAMNNEVLNKEDEHTREHAAAEDAAAASTEVPVAASAEVPVAASAEAPAVLAAVFSGDVLDQSKIDLFKEALAEGTMATFVGEFAPKGPDGNAMVIPGTAVGDVMSLLKAGFSDMTFNREKVAFAKGEDGLWAADIMVGGTHDGSFTPMPGMLPPVEATNKAAVVGPEKFSFHFSDDGKIDKMTIEPLKAGPAGPPGFYVIVGGTLP